MPIFLEGGSETNRFCWEMVDINLHGSKMLGSNTISNYLQKCISPLFKILGSIEKHAQVFAM